MKIKQNNGSVTLSLDEYNELRDFKNNILNGNVYVIQSFPWSGDEIGFKTQNEALAMAQEYNKNMASAYISASKSTDAAMNKLASMSIFQFLKWRKKNKKRDVSE